MERKCKTCKWYYDNKCHNKEFYEMIQAKDNLEIEFERLNENDTIDKIMDRWDIDDTNFKLGLEDITEEIISDIFNNVNYKADIHEEFGCNLWE